MFVTPALKRSLVVAAAVAAVIPSWSAMASDAPTLDDRALVVDLPAGLVTLRSIDVGLAPSVDAPSTRKSIAITPAAYELAGSALTIHLDPSTIPSDYLSKTGVALLDVQAIDISGGVHRASVPVQSYINPSRGDVSWAALSGAITDVPDLGSDTGYCAENYLPVTIPSAVSSKLKCFYPDDLRVPKVGLPPVALPGVGVPPVPSPGVVTVPNVPAVGTYAPDLPLEDITDGETDVLPPTPAIPVVNEDTVPIAQRPYCDAGDVWKFQVRDYKMPFEEKERGMQINNNPKGGRDATFNYQVSRSSTSTYSMSAGVEAEASAAGFATIKANINASVARSKSYSSTYGGSVDVPPQMYTIARAGFSRIVAHGVSYFLQKDGCRKTNQNDVTAKAPIATTWKIQTYRNGDGPASRVSAPRTSTSAEATRPAENVAPNAPRLIATCGTANNPTTGTLRVSPQFTVPIQCDGITTAITIVGAEPNFAPKLDAPAGVASNLTNTVAP